jgi:ribosomally synthesized peptide
MSSDLERLIGRALTDKAFRDQLLNDPEGAIQSAGLSLSSDELDRVKQGIGKLKASGDAQQLEQQLGSVFAW